MVKTTKAQRCALFNIFRRDFPGWVSPSARLASGRPGTVKVPTIQWRRFRKLVVGYADGSGCVMVPWKGMWLGVETDGYTHS